MLYRILADGVLVAHFSFILFVVFGGLLALRSRKILFLHVPAVIWSFLVQWNQWICPLTPLENWFRDFAGHAGYEGGFIDHYILPLLYVQTGRWLHVSLAIFVVLLNLSIYFVVFKKLRKSNGMIPA